MVARDDASTLDLYASLKGADGRTLFRAAARLAPFTRPPVSVSIDNEEIDAEDGWLERCVAHGEVECVVTFADRCSLAWKPREHLVYVEAPGLPRAADAVVTLLGDLPFELASFKSLHRWFRRPAYEALGFGGLHVDFGWGCMLKGAGHARLVSRRWLAHGPWQLARAGADLSLVQFHDLDAPMEDAYAQAAPGHRLLGNTDDSGFLTLGAFRYRHDLAGRHDEAPRRRVIDVVGRDVSRREMLEACRARALPAEVGRPAGAAADRVAFVFAEGDRARAHLRDLWLRELECWVITAGDEIRLDEVDAP